MGPPRLRAEVIRRDEGDRILLFDPLLDRLHELPVEPLDPPLGARLAWLEERLLLEGPVAERLRAEAFAVRRGRVALPDPAPGVEPIDEGLAEELPDGVSPRWREAEAWRRAAEERAAGRGLCVLRGFLAPRFVEVLRQEARALALQRMDTAVVHGERATSERALPRLRELLLDEACRRLCGMVLGVALPAALRLNVWRLSPGDHFGPHPDGPRYRATFALGLNPGWRAADGGAIAFGPPLPDGRIEVRERFLPFAGDLALFVPGPRTWHVVEAPARERLTASGWWLAG